MPLFLFFLRAPMLPLVQRIVEQSNLYNFLPSPMFLNLHRLRYFPTKTSSPPLKRAIHSVFRLLTLLARPSKPDIVLPPICAFASFQNSQWQDKGKAPLRRERQQSSSPSPPRPTQGPSGFSKNVSTNISESTKKKAKRHHRKKTLHRKNNSSSSSSSSSESDEDCGFKQGDFLQSSNVHPTTPCAE